MNHMETMQTILDLKAKKKAAREALKEMLISKGKTEEYEKKLKDLENLSAQIDELEKLAADEAKGLEEPGTTKDFRGAAQPDDANKRHDAAVKAFAQAARNGFRVTEKGASGTPMSEGVNGDGGYTVPEEIVTDILQLRSSEESLLDEVTVDPVKTNKGARTIQTRGDITGFATVDELAAAGPLATPTFARVPWTIEDRSGILPVGRDLLADTDQNLVAVIEKFMADNARVTANKEIVAEIKAKWLSVATFTSLDDIVDAWLDLGPAFRNVSRVITNTSGIKWLSKQVDGQGKKVFAPNPTNPKEMQLCVGGAIMPVKEYGMDVLPDNTTKIPFFIGSLKDAIRYFDRQMLTIEQSDSAVVGELNAFTQSLRMFRGTIRDDCAQVDAAALTFGELDTATLTFGELDTATVPDPGTP